jgi:1-acyl-sn-glycerol-3-phosphate acyltransferase
MAQEPTIRHAVAGDDEHLGAGEAAAEGAAEAPAGDEVPRAGEAAAEGAAEAPAGDEVHRAGEAAVEGVAEAPAGDEVHRAGEADVDGSLETPQPGTDLRPYLPGAELERRTDDWGRSERLEGALDRTVIDFLYRLWFRCEVEGVDYIPSHGGALLVSNHSGALPPDAPMIAKAVKEEHPRPRPVYLTAEHFFKGYPGFSMLLPKIGAVAAHPANVHRLLYDEGQLVLVFPEGRKGSEKLYKDRYRLQRFGRGGFVEAAMRARAPIVPVAVVGAEEAAPIFAHLRPLQRLTGLLYVPLTPTFPHFGLLGMLGYLPAKFHIRFLPPVRTDAMGDEPWTDKALVQTVADEIRETIQDELIDMLGERRSVWF